MKTITEIAIQFPRLRRIKSFSSTFNRNLIPHLQFSLLLILVRIQRSPSVERIEFAFRQRLRSRILARPRRSRYLSLLRPKLGSVFSLSTFSIVLRSFSSFSLSSSLVSFLFLHDKSSIKYLRFACTCEICGDILTISICTRCPTVNSRRSLLDQIFTSVRKFRFFFCSKIFV